MLSKAVLVDRIVNSLLKRGFEVFLTRGCFDIATKRDKLILIKCLTNIDGLNQEHAKSLRSISYFLSAHPFVISVRNNRNFLANDMIYSRFELPVVTLEMFERVIEEEAYKTMSAKGRHAVEIDELALRTKRNELNFTLDELSKLVGISKKAMYEIENKRTNPTEHTATKLERTLKIKLRKIYQPQPAEKSEVQPANALQRIVNKELDRMGVENTSVRHAPFEIVGRGKYTFMTGLSKNTRKMKRIAGPVKKISTLVESSAFFVSKKSREKTVEGLPILLEQDLSEIESEKELKKLIEEYAE